MAKIDNDKMWESILNQLPTHREVSRVHILEALKEQGLVYNPETKEIEWIKKEAKIPEGWYVAKKNFHDDKLDGAYGMPVFCKGECTPKEKVFATIPYMTEELFAEYFELPTTPEEIPQEPKQESSDDELSEFENRLGEIMIPTWDITKGHEECKGEVKEEVLNRNDKTKLMQKCIKAAYKRGYDMGVLQTTNKINSNTKEVDLEKEIESVRKTHFINSDFEKATLDGRQITNIAKHFFELGIRAQKGEQV